MNTYNLRHVQNDNSGLETDTDTGNETTNNDGNQSRSRVVGVGIVRHGDHLDDNTDSVDGTAKNNSPLATHPVGKVTSDESTEESTDGEDRDDQRLVALRELRDTGAFDGLDEDVVAIDTVDVTRVVTEEDTTERGEGAHEVSLPGNGSLDLLDRFRGMEDDRGLADLGGLFVLFHLKRRRL